MFPIRWEEPFGIVMVEAMACGTPVVALPGGSVPEVVAHGVTGFVCRGPSELPAAIRRAETILPQACRERAAAHFSVDRMAEGYEAVYSEAVLAGITDPAGDLEIVLRAEATAIGPTAIGASE